MGVICVADSDTRLKWTRAVADALADQAGPVTGFFLLGNGAVPSPRQFDEIGITRPVDVTTASELAANPSVLAADVVVVCTRGGNLSDVRRHLVEATDGMPRRPLLVTGYAGVVYEKQVEGVLWRTGCDLVCVNSSTDLALFCGILRDAGLDDSALVLTGLPLVHAVERVTTNPEVTTLTFAVQPDVPRRRADRRYIAGRLVAHARMHQDRTVVVKLRSRPDEVTTHREDHHYEPILRDVAGGDLPPNLELAYGPMGDTLERTDLLVTVSSTAAMEAWARGIPAGILSDLGVAESLGNHHFLGCGALVTFDGLDAGVTPTVDPDWLARHGVGDASLDHLCDAVAAMLVEQRRCGHALAWPEAFHGTTRTPGLHALRSRAGSNGGARSRTRRLARRIIAGPLAATTRRLRTWVDE